MDALADPKDNDADDGADDGADNSAAASSTTFARVDLADLQIVIPAAQVLHAMPRPAELTRLPRSEGPVDGVLSWGDQPAPVVDLRKWLDASADLDEVLPYLVVLGEGDKVIALAASAVVGMLRVPDSHVQQVHRDQADDGFFHSVVRSQEDGELFSQLDASILMEKVLSWAQTTDLTATEPSPHQHASTDSAAIRSNASLGAGGLTSAYAMVRIGQDVLAIDALLVAQVLVAPAIDSELSLTDKLLGLSRWHGGSLTIIDPNNLLGIPIKAAESALLLVLSDGKRWAGLPVDEVLSVRRIADSVIDPAVHVASRYVQFYRGSYVQPDQQRALVLNATTLLAECPLSDIFDGAAAAGVAAMTKMDLDKGQIIQDSHIAFSADSTWAINIRHVKEIVPVPSSFKVITDSDNALVGTCDWRSKYLPIMVLSPTSPDQLLQKRMIVTECNGRHLGILVDEILALLPARSGTLLSFTPPFGSRLQMLVVNSERGQESYRLFELATLAFFRDQSGVTVTPDASTSSTGSTGSTISTPAR